MASFAVGADGIFYIPPAEPDGRQQIEYYRYSDRTTHLVYESADEITTPALAPDGRSLVFAVEADSRSDLYLATGDEP